MYGGLLVAGEDRSEGLTRTSPALVLIVSQEAFVASQSPNTKNLLPDLGVLLETIT